MKWKKDVKAALKAGKSEPPVTDYIGKCFLDIAERLSYRPNFINYPFRDEMVGDGIENCLMYASNFDPAKSKNPFSYFTQIIYYAFIRRIQKEKKQNYIKYKSIEAAELSGKIPKWMKNFYQDERKRGEFFSSLSLTENDLHNFEGTPKQDTQEPVKATKKTQMKKKGKKK